MSIFRTKNDPRYKLNRSLILPEWHRLEPNEQNKLILVKIIMNYITFKLHLSSVINQQIRFKYSY